VSEKGDRETFKDSVINSHKSEICPEGLEQDFR